MTLWASSVLLADGCLPRPSVLAKLPESDLPAIAVKIALLLTNRVFMKKDLHFAHPPFITRLSTVGVQIFDCFCRQIGLGQFRKYYGGRERQKSANRTDDAHRQAVRDHIQSFPTVESHYCRKKSQRLYLDSKLTIQRMYELYVEKCKQITLMLISRFHQHCTGKSSLKISTWVSTNPKKITAQHVRNMT